MCIDLLRRSKEEVAVTFDLLAVSFDSLAVSGSIEFTDLNGSSFV